MLRFSRSLILHYLEDIKTQHLSMEEKILYKSIQKRKGAQGLIVRPLSSLYVTISYKRSKDLADCNVEALTMERFSGQ